MTGPSTRAVRRSANLPSVRGQRFTPPARLAEEGGRAAWQIRLRDANQLVVLDLFCGAGGLSQGFYDAGFFVAAGLDLDPRAAETHAANFLADSRAADLFQIDEPGIRDLVRRQLELPRVDVLIGGPPCQGFAAVGRAKIRSLSDERRQELEQRNHLYREFVRFVATLKPRCFVMENVPQLGSYDDGSIVARIRDDFDTLGFDIGFVDAPGEPALLEAAYYGVPQTRRRLFFVGFRRGAAAPITAPRPTHYGRLIYPRNRDEHQPDQLPLAVRRGRVGLTNFFMPPPRTLADAIADLPRVRAPALEHLLPYARVDRQDLVERGALRDPAYATMMRAGLGAEDAGFVFDHVVRPVREDDAEAFLLIPKGGTYHDVPATDTLALLTR